jgi:hypothetical protein
MEAAHNFISFLANVTGSETSPPYIRWSQHFGYFEAAEDAEANFIAILTTDIDLRRKYASQPFKYERGFYERELNKSVMDMKMAKMKSEFEARLSSGTSSSSRPMVPPSLRGGTGGGASGSGGGDGGAGGSDGRRLLSGKGGGGEPFPQVQVT